VRNPAAADVFTSIAAGATTVFTFAVPRSFDPHNPISVISPVGFQAGINIGQPWITGNSPSTGASVKGYTLNLPITNSTAGALTPTSQKLSFVQD
jgi:hypothetical protein